MSQTATDPKDSLRRVLTSIKEDARSMRKDRINERLNPKKVEAAPEEEEEVLTLDVPEEALMEPAEAAEKKTEKDRDANAIRKLLQRV